MIVSDRKYTLDEIKIGMWVGMNQLSRIADRYILLEDTRMEEDKLGFPYLYGRVAKISREPIRLTEEHTIVAYTNGLELEEYFEYE